MRGKVLPFLEHPKRQGGFAAGGVVTLHIRRANGGAEPSPLIERQSRKIHRPGEDKDKIPAISWRGLTPNRAFC
jgi:hypothetical protein